jgi:Major Facilitator Superfamily
LSAGWSTDTIRGPVLGFGFSVLAIALTWLSFEMAPDTPIWRLALPFFAVGVGSAFVRSPLTATATRNLPPRLSGASSGVYNAIRQLGAALGSGGMAAFMTSPIGAEKGPHAPAPEGVTALQLPEFVREPFSAAMSQSMLLPAFIALFGIVAALFLVGFTASATTREPHPEGGYLPGDPPDDGDFVDDDYDDDDYVEYILLPDLLPDPDIGPQGDTGIEPAYQKEGDTAPLQTRFRHPRPAPADAWHSDPVESWHSLLDHPVSVGHAEPIGFAHNGSHVDDGQRFRPIAEFSARSFKVPPHGDRLAPPSARQQSGSAHHQLTEGEAPRNQHYRPDPDDDPASYGRHSSG